MSLNTKFANLEHEVESKLDRLDKMSRIGTSCSEIASLGNLESGMYLLDTDADGGEAPFEVK